jgi:hypothetical protein
VEAAAEAYQVKSRELADLLRKLGPSRRAGRSAIGLRSRGCIEAQGYFFGTSVPPPEIEQVLAAGAAPRGA